MPEQREVKRFQQGALTVTVSGGLGQRRTLHLDGEADLASAAAITHAMSTLLDVPGGDVVVDLSGVTFMDSTGVRALLVGNAIAAQRRPMVLRSPRPNVRRVLEVLDLDEVFDITG